MKLSILERLLLAHRPSAKVSSLGFVSKPVALRFASPPEDAPWVTSLTTGAFSLTRSKDGEVGQGFFQCPIDDEDVAFNRFWHTCLELSSKHGWGNRCSTIAEGVARISSFGLEPKYLVIPYTSIWNVVGEELTEEQAESISMQRGCVAEIDGVQVISGRKALPDGSALISTARPLVGVYNRFDDALGITLTRADKSVVLVSSHAVA